MNRIADHPLPPRPHRLLLLCLGLLVLAPAAHAERADRGKPINVEADSVKVDDQKKVASYEGHVVMTQGTLMITADRIEVRQDDKGVVSGLATGNPVYFRQKMDASNEYAEGWAQRIDYDGQGDKIRLSGQARLKRGIDELRGDQITYDSSTEFFQAKGGTSGPSGRVRAVIRPRNGAGTSGTDFPAPVKP
jgi:lipopolysaccharide export system protein LptA